MHFTDISPIASLHFTSTLLYSTLLNPTPPYDVMRYSAGTATDGIRSPAVPVLLPSSPLSLPLVLAVDPSMPLNRDVLVST